MKLTRRNNAASRHRAKTDNNSGLPWIDITGGMGDAMLLSGVLKSVYDLQKKPCCNLRRRTQYLSLFRHHPAISLIGIPPRDARLVRTDYWHAEQLGPATQRPYQILARMFGLPTPIEERLFLPGRISGDPVLRKYLPKGKKRAMIAPYSVSPRKMMKLEKWRELIARLRAMDFNVIQVGDSNAKPVSAEAFCMIGLTNPQELLHLIGQVNVVITVDNFIMHCAHLAHTPAVVLWGPTAPEIYGYPEQVHLQMNEPPCQDWKNCLGRDFPKNYFENCPQQFPCMDRIATEKIIDAIGTF